MGFGMKWFLLTYSRPVLNEKFRQEKAEKKIFVHYFCSFFLCIKKKIPQVKNYSQLAKYKPCMLYYWKKLAGKFFMAAFYSFWIRYNILYNQQQSHSQQDMFHGGMSSGPREWTWMKNTAKFVNYKPNISIFESLFCCSGMETFSLN